ncbi:hypothetical protein [Leptospira idonii]|uniref:hypothetical protein n=1 Tax=Leptospira idonii TaxID=1193500 RepID=UPI001AF0159A|nr:hypothetical protein [Leptospira idonii]
MIFKDSHLLKLDLENYMEKTPKELAILQSIDAIPVHRNSGIDGFLKKHHSQFPVPIQIQSERETLEDCIEKIQKASSEKNFPLKIIIQTQRLHLSEEYTIPSDIRILQSMDLQI